MLIPRAIEFRLWDRTVERFLYSYTPHKGEQPKREFIFQEFCIGFSNYSIDDFSIDQFTGLKDKAGIKIYENDIIKFDDFDNCYYDCDGNPSGGIEFENYGQIIFENGKFKLGKLFKYNGNISLNKITDLNEILAYNGLIIGNIYQKPELLK